jgi:hypothetical protein
MGSTARIETRGNPFVTSLRPLLVRPRHVLLNERALLVLGKRIAQERFSVPSWRESVFPQTDDEIFVNFIGVGNAINFAFTDFETHQSFQVQWLGKEWRGAYAMWACLSRALENDGNILDGTFLMHLTLQEAKRIFTGSSELPLLNERLKNLREIGAVLTAKYNGNFWNLVRTGSHRTFGPDGVLERLVTDFHSFRDAGKQADAELKFHKRAQLFAMMYEGRARSSYKLQRLADSDLLGPIADYDIPRVLHAAGVLEYSPDLEHKVQTWQPIEANSLEEMEIRAQAVNAQTLLLARINDLRSDEKIDFLALDYKLWCAGRQLKEPHHLTKTTAY